MSLVLGRSCHLVEGVQNYSQTKQLGSRLLFEGQPNKQEEYKSRTTSKKFKNDESRAKVGKGKEKQKVI